MHKDPDFSYINKNGRKVSGAAATLHEIYTVHDGVKDYNDNVGAEYIAEFVREHSDIINEGIERKSRRKQLKVVGK